VKLADSTSSDLNMKLDNLRPFALYEISVWFQYGTFTGPKSTITTATAPVPPPQLSIKKVEQNSVTVLVNLQGVRVAESTKVLSLTLHYTKMNDAGSSVVPGTALTRTIAVQGVTKAIEVALSDLAAGTTYSVKYKLTVSNIVGTSDSEYNNAVIVRTTYEKSELEQFKDTLGLSDIQKQLATQRSEIKSGQTGLAGVTKAQAELSTKVAVSSTSLSSLRTSVTKLQDDVHKGKRRFYFRKKDPNWKPAINHWTGEYVEEPIKACGRRRFRNAVGDIIYYNGQKWGVTYINYANVVGCGTGFDSHAREYNGDILYTVWDHYYVVDPEVIRH